MGYLVVTYFCCLDDYACYHVCFISYLNDSIIMVVTVVYRL